MPPRPKKFICTICKSQSQGAVDYKNPGFLAGFVTFYRSIQSRFHTGICLKHQKKLAQETKKARQMALMGAVRYES